MVDGMWNLEDLAGIKSDPDQDTRVNQALGIPAGGYNSVPELLMDRQEGGPESQHPGRKSAHFYGSFQGITVREDPTDKNSPLMDPQPFGRASFDVSWEYFDSVDFETKEVQSGKPDLRYKLYHQAAKVYRQVNGLHPKDQVSPTEVLPFLQKYPVHVVFRYFEGRDTPLAVSISRAKEG